MSDERVYLLPPTKVIREYRSYLNAEGDAVGEWRGDGDDEWKPLPSAPDQPEGLQRDEIARLRAEVERLRGIVSLGDDLVGRLTGGGRCELCEATGHYGHCPVGDYLKARAALEDR